MSFPDSRDPVPVPLHFDTPAGWCMGWFHPPAVAARDIVLVLCQPVGHEAICSYPTQVQLARTLAHAGIPVFRFDYHGTGDSEGDDTLAGRVPAWLASVEAAVAQARTASGASRVALLGIRLGATLAVEAAARLGGVDRLVLWAPCPGGKALVRELRAAGLQDEAGGVHAFGHRYGAATVQELLALDATRPACAPARSALVIGRDDLPGEGPLPKALRQLGVDVSFQVLPGYAAMVDEPRAGVLSPETLHTLAEWLSADVPLREGQVPPLQLRDPVSVAGPVRESMLQLRPGGALHGVLSEPAAGAPGDRRGQTGIVLLNVGGNYRIGPHRFYVTAARALAAAGHRVLRLDLAGIGDSPPQPGQPWANLYSKDSTQDVRVALDALALRGCRDVVLMGVCSGSFVAFQSALADPRVGGVVLMNSRLLEWTPGKPGDSWQTSMLQYAKSTAWYRRELLRPEVWWRLVRGDVNVRMIARRFVDLTAARLKRLVTPGAAESLTHKMRKLCRRGCNVLMVVSDADDGRDYVEFHFGPDGRRMQGHPNFRMTYVQDADHTFSRPGNQPRVLDDLLRHLEQRLAAPPAAAPTADRVLPPDQFVLRRPL